VSYSEIVSKHRRLTILRFLADSPDYTSNASILTDVCNGYAVRSTRDQVTTDLLWLAEQGFVTREERGGFVIATVTQRGIEIAQGAARHDGIQRPRPGG
jgi:Fe2+ or Zn2+ uptake regulation protein